MRRRPRPVLASLAPPVALVLAGAVALAGCSSGGDEPGPDPEAAAVVRAAPDTSVEPGSSRYGLTSSTEIGEQPLEITGEGQFDYAGREGLLTLTLPTGTVEQRVVDDTVYLALSEMPGVFYELALDDVQGTSIGGSTDPTASFAALRAANEDVTEVGTEEVRGEQTTHYRGTIDVEQALAASDGAARQLAEATLGRSGLDALPFDVWLDEEGRVRRYQQSLDVPASDATGGQEVETTTTVELYDFGVDVAVEPPPADQVRDGAPLLRALRGQQAPVGR